MACAKDYKMHFNQVGIQERYQTLFFVQLFLKLHKLIMKDDLHITAWMLICSFLFCILILSEIKESRLSLEPQYK